MRRAPTLIALLALVVPGTATAAPAVQEPFSFSRPAFPTLSNPRASDVGDVDEDGAADIVSTVGINEISWGVSVLPGRPTGYGRAIFSPTGMALTSLQVIDANGDGALDAVVGRDTGEGTFETWVMGGLGDGTFAEPSNAGLPAHAGVEMGMFTPGARPGAVAATDGGLTYFRPVPGITFAYAEDRDLLGGSFSRLLAMDMDGDGVDELAAIGQGKVRLFRSLQLVATQDLASAAALDAADTTGDGRPELLVTSSDGAVRVFDASLSQLRIIPPAFSAVGATAGDLDGDGTAEIVRLNDAPIVSVLWGTGGRLDVPVSGPAYGAWVRDATGDGHADLVTVQNAAAMVEVVEGDGAGGFAPQRPAFATNPNGWMMRSADFNGDGKRDVIAAELNYILDGYTKASTATVRLGDGAGGFTFGGTISTQGSSTGMDVGDVNGDGKQDVVISDYHSGSVSQYLGNGDGTFGQRIYVPGCPLNDAVVIGDFNGDAYADAAAGCREAIMQQTLSIFLGSPTGLTPGKPQGLSQSNLPFVLRVGDINGDGNQDILFDSNQSVEPCLPPCIGITSSYDGALTYFLGLGNGVFEPVTRNYLVGRRVFGSWVADVTGDGRGDVLATIPFDDQVQIAPGRADGTLGVPYSIDVPEYPVDLRVGDVTGDGKPDLVITHGPRLVTITPGNGDGTFGESIGYATRFASGEPAIGRFDGDAKLDFVLPQGSSAEVFLQGR